jgi:hypothetical protein
MLPLGLLYFVRIALDLIFFLFRARARSSVHIRMQSNVWHGTAKMTSSNVCETAKLGVETAQATDGDKTREILHVWMKMWPDHGVPVTKDGSAYAIQCTFQSTFQCTQYTNISHQSIILSLFALCTVTLPCAHHVHRHSPMSSPRAPSLSYELTTCTFVPSLATMSKTCTFPFNKLSNGSLNINKRLDLVHRYPDEVLSMLKFVRTARKVIDADETGEGMGLVTRHSACELPPLLQQRC